MVAEEIKSVEGDSMKGCTESVCSKKEEGAAEVGTMHNKLRGVIGKKSFFLKLAGVYSFLVEFC